MGNYKKFFKISGKWKREIKKFFCFFFLFPYLLLKRVEAFIYFSPKSSSKA